MLFRSYRHGYGVMELVMEGEKYLGMWSDGVRQGPGCVVNIDGVYYQAMFIICKGYYTLSNLASVS